MLNDGSTKIAYLNPCAHHWIDEKEPNNEVRFSSNDTAVCVVTSAADVEGAEGYISIDMSIKYEMDGDELEKMIQLGQQGPSMHVIRLDGAQNPRAIMNLDWTAGDYTDFKRGRTTSYGASFFNADPTLKKFRLISLFNDPTTPFFNLSDDQVKLFRHAGTVALEKAEIFVFHPGSYEFLQDSVCDYSKVTQEGKPTWITEKTDGNYPSNGDYLEMDEGNADKCKELKVLGPDSLGGKR